MSTSDAREMLSKASWAIGDMSYTMRRAEECLMVNDPDTKWRIENLVRDLEVALPYLKAALDALDREREQ